MTGWDLVQTIERSVGYFWNVTRSQVYRELKTLAELGLVAAGKSGSRDRVPYSITAAGHRAFDAWIAEKPGPELLRMPIVVQVFFGASVQPEVLSQHLEEVREEHATRLEAYEALASSVSEPYQRATLDLGLAFEKMVLKWLATLPEVQIAAKRQRASTARRTSSS